MKLTDLFPFLKPEPEEPPKKPSTPEKTSDSQDSERWTTASTGVRTTAQWLATSLGATAGVIFGAGPLISNKTDVTDWDPNRWLLVLGAASIGVLGVLAIVSRLVAAMLPVEVTLDGLPPSLRKKIEEDPQGYLPGDAQNLTDFRNRLRGYSRATAALEIQARREKDPEQKKLIEDRAKIAADNRDVYRQKRSELVAQAKYHIESSRLGGKGNTAWFAAAAIAAVIGVSVFTFLTHAPDDDSDDDAPAPQGALLIPKDGSQEIWEELDLNLCVPQPQRAEPIDPQSGVPQEQADVNEGRDQTVPVLLLGTSGENKDQYKVQTLGYPSGCGRYTFSVSGDIVDVVLPQPKKVTLSTPSATPEK